MSDPLIFFWTATSAAYTAAITPNGSKTFLAGGGSTFFINDKQNQILWMNHVIFFFWFITFSVVPFDQITLLSIDLLLT